MTTIQMNIRIDPALKASGDTALALAGLTPTLFVRRAWEFASRNAANPAAILEAFATPEDDVAHERARKIELAERGASYLRNEAATLGICFDKPIPEFSYAELREAAFDEWLEEHQ